MTYLLDTNVVVRLLEPQAPEHEIVKAAAKQLVATGDTLVIAPQVLVELWVIATRPVEANGFGWDVPATANAIDELRRQFSMLSETPAVFDHWLSLVKGNHVRGKRAHDARIAASMIANGVSHILTLNPDDFRMPSIVPVHPADVLAGRPIAK